MVSAALRTRPAARARPSTTMRLVRYAPLGRCLYCLASGVPLTEEHLIPRTLGGRLTLRDAVCEPCRRATGRLEQATLDREFAVPKTLLALKRRRARGKGPHRLPLVAVVGEPRVDPPLDQGSYPRSFALPTFERAGLLTGADRSCTRSRIDFVDCRLQLGTPTRDAVAVPPPMSDPYAYGFSIAKWAYTLAVAERGLDGFDTGAMRQLLSGERNDVFSFVGTSPTYGPAVADWLHSATLREDGPWLIVVLALFASAGMTPYEVVVGPLRLHAE